MGRYFWGDTLWTMWSAVLGYLARRPKEEARRPSDRGDAVLRKEADRIARFMRHFQSA